VISLHVILIYCSVYAVAIAVPGPGIIAIVARALKGGTIATVPAVIGNTLGDIIMMSLSVFGLAFVAHELGGLFLIVKLAGAAYLIYLGYRYWTAPIAEIETAPSDASGGFLSQLALTIGNPKVIVMFVALLPTVIDLHRLNMIGYAELCICTLILIPSIEFGYAVMAAQARVFLTGVAARKRMNKTAGAVMVGAGIGVIAS
jgi:threonine/homoserine/homoserine lactone efflux protein